MNKYSRSNKENAVLMTIEEELRDMELSEIKRYFDEFRREPDYNIVQYGNLRIYYDDVRDLYKEYKSYKQWSNEKLWYLYRFDVGRVVRRLLNDYGYIRG